MEGRETAARIVCLINPRAADSKWIRRRDLRAQLRNKLPGEIRDIAGDPEATIENAKSACFRCDILAAMGGDGTIAAALEGMFDSGREKEILFGVIPLGTGNAFRKAFGIPKNPRKAVDTLVSGRPRWIDLMEIEGRVGAFASIGATAEVTRERAGLGIGGMWGFLWAGRKLYSQRPAEKELALVDGWEGSVPFDRKTITSDFFDCVIAKTPYFGYGWRIAPRALVDDGFLDITLFEIGPVKYTLLFPFLYLGLIQTRFRHFKAREIVVSGPGLPVQYHGEFLGFLDRVTARVLPRALRIVCPDTKRAGKHFLVRP
jgi:diacylglycerol kinase (ATP)